MDVLSDVVAAMRTGTPHSRRAYKRSPWGTRFAPFAGAGFHVVLQGSCWLAPERGEPVRLGVGDVAFLPPHAGGHALADRPVGPRPDLPPSSPGWTRALADAAVGAALRAIHEQPARAWTVSGLARVGGLSRAAFARRFTALTGRPPLAYLTWWRMTIAARVLRDTSAPLSTVAARTGYTSEFAFAKAFKREYGVTPGRYRQAT